MTEMRGCEFYYQQRCPTSGTMNELVLGEHKFKPDAYHPRLFPSDIASEGLNVLETEYCFGKCTDCKTYKFLKALQKSTDDVI
jgi:hypothetical protein